MTTTNKIFVAVLVLAALLRLSYLEGLQADPFSRHPILDAAYYSNWAEIIAAGGLRPTPGFWGGPLYPYFLALVFRTGGGPTAARAVQHLLGVFICVIIFKAAVAVSTPATALLAAFLYAIYSPALFYEGWLLSEPLAAFLTVALFLALLRTAEGRPAAGGLAAGALAALLTLVRPSLIPLGALGWLAASKTVRKKAAAGSFLLGLTAVLVAGGGLYYRYTGQFTLISPHGGANFWLGNGPGATGSVWSPPFARPSPSFQVEDFRREASRRAGKELSFRQSSSFWFRQTAAEIAARPLRFLRLFVRKLWLFFGDGDFSDIYHWSLFRRRMPLLGIPFDWRLLSPLAVVGMIAAWNRRRRFGLVYVFVFAYSVSIALFFVTSRHRFPIAGIFCLAAAEGVRNAREQLRRRNFLGIGALGMMTAALLVLFGAHGIAPPDYQFYISAGEVYYRDGNYEQAEEYLKRAERDLAESTRHPSIGTGLYMARGRVLLGRGEVKEAADYFDRFLKVWNRAAREGFFEIGGAYADHGLLDRAEEYYLRSVKSDPGFYPAWNNLGVVYQRRGRPEEARRAFLQAIEANPAYAPARLNLERMEERKSR